ncbi:MAG: hypothetical protein PPP56_11435 [Longimonas sp.]|uniref:hypothetical protein n=1 Tax=Longimonas sp. TaxID=2039626 RepID=UPI0033513B4C
MSHPFRIPLILLAAACCLAACTSTSTHTGSTRAVLSSSYDATFYAVLDVFNAHDLTPETVDYDAGHIAARGAAQFGYAPYRVVDAEAFLDPASEDRVELRLLFTFQEQAAERPRPVPRREDESRVLAYTFEGLDRSREAAYAYGFYVDAIRERARELHPHSEGH